MLTIVTSICAEPGKAHGRRAAVERPVHDEQLLGGQDDPRPLPLPHRPERDARASHLQQNAHDRGRPTDCHAADADHGEPKRTQERSGENDDMSPLIETDALSVGGNHRVCGFRQAWKDPWS